MKTTLLLILLCGNTFSQDTLKPFQLFSDSFMLTIDTSTSFGYIDFPSVYSFIPGNFVHNIISEPTKEDSLFYYENKELINKKPTKENYSKYYTLACALKNINKLKEAEKMFLTIVKSYKSFYTETYRISSDIPGDTTTNSYGYGSFTSNYKNKTCRNLTEINLLKNEFKKALLFLKKADKKYHVSFSCGTGNRFYQKEIRDLYGLCYQGLKEYDKIIKLYLNSGFDSFNELLFCAIKLKYSDKEIKKHLIIAENSLNFKLNDHHNTSTTIHNYGKEDEYETHTRYTLGVATINLFGFKLEVPDPILENGEIATKEMYLKKLKNSRLYSELTISFDDEDYDEEDF